MEKSWASRVPTKDKDGDYENKVDLHKSRMQQEIEQITKKFQDAHKAIKEESINSVPS